MDICKRPRAGGRARRGALRAVACLMGALLVAGLVPVAPRAAYAGTEAYTSLVPTSSDTEDTLANKAVTFGGEQWYVIADDSTSATAGTLTLLANDCLATSQFHASSNAYASSTVKTVLDDMVDTGDLADYAGAMVATDLADVSVTGAKLWLLSTSEAGALPESVRKAGIRWWLRSPGSDDF